MKLSSSGRKALQPRNIFPAEDIVLKPKARAPKQQEKKTVVDASLAEELTAVKKKLERLRDDLDRTQKLLDGRDVAMDLHMACLLQKGDAQKILEIQVDRLFRLKELHAYSSKISPIRSLRAKELEKRKPLAIEPAGDADEPETEQEHLSVSRRNLDSSPIDSICM